MPSLNGRVAIITGAARGIGEAAAVRFANEGSRLAIVDRNAPELSAVAERIAASGGDVLPIAADLRGVDDAKRIVSETLSRFGALHILFNNAALTDLDKTVTDLSIEEWDECCAVNLRSVFLLAKWAAPQIRDSGGGCIINMGSVGGIVPWSGGAAYCACKAGVLALTKVLAIELGQWNIRVNTLSPGAVMTPNLTNAIAKRSSWDEIRARSVLNRVGDPAEIASAAVFLASDESSFMTGANLVMDGGYLAH